MDIKTSLAAVLLGGLVFCISAQCMWPAVVFIVLAIALAIWDARSRGSSGGKQHAPVVALIPVILFVAVAYYGPHSLAFSIGIAIVAAVYVWFVLWFLAFRANAKDTTP